jgi:hypothetical protein
MRALLSRQGETPTRAIVSSASSADSLSGFAIPSCQLLINRQVTP